MVFLFVDFFDVLLKRGDFVFQQVYLLLVSFSLEIKFVSNLDYFLLLHFYNPLNLVPLSLRLLLKFPVFFFPLIDFCVESDQINIFVLDELLFKFGDDIIFF